MKNAASGTNVLGASDWFVFHVPHKAVMEIYPNRSLDECLTAVRDDPWFHP